MHAMQTTICVRTRKKAEVVDLTKQVADAVSGSGVGEGVRGFRLDLVAALGKLFREGVWEHDTVDDNGAAHLKAAVLGPSRAVPDVRR
jgi:thiamine phosphate synthase YjbQ (UPF0047 family)